YAWAGDRAAALRQYRACVRVLDEELGVAPLPETTRVAELLRENRSPPPPEFPDGSAAARAYSAQARPVVPATAGFPLVGRGREWDALQEAYAAATERGCFVVLQGEPGIGKTRLAEGFAE